MQSSKNATVEIIESSGEDNRIEIMIEPYAGDERVVLRYSTWVDGLGWCGQKTIKLDGEQIEDLHRALTVARHRINHRRAEAGQMREAAKVIRLPTLA